MMMKKYMYLFVGGLLITACTDTTEDVGLPTDNEVRFGGGMGQTALSMSKAEGDGAGHLAEDATQSFVDGATMGVYAYKTDGADYEANGINGKYVCSNSVFACETVEGGLPLYWPTWGALNFIAYSPYDAGIVTPADAASTPASAGASTSATSASEATSPGTVTYTMPSIANQSAKMATDVLYAFKTEVPAGRAPVELTFGHALAKLNVVLEGAFGMEFVTNPIVKIKGLKTSAEISLSIAEATPVNQSGEPTLAGTAVISPSGEVTEMIPFQAADATARKASVSMLVVPQEVTLPDTDFEFIYIRNSSTDTEGDKYKLKIKSSTDLPFIKEGKLIFAAGKEYTLTLTLKNKEAEIKNAQVDIKAWVLGTPASGGGDAEWPEMND